MGALAIGLASGVICFFTATNIKQLFGYDDSLDVFGVHAMGGIVGAILTGVFCAEQFGGAGFGGEITTIGEQVMVQTKSVIVTVIYSGVVSALILGAISVVMGLRVDEEQEETGLDMSLHQERGYII
jgi:Amt family ammonium transporter